MERVEGLEPEIDAAIAEALQRCIQETELDVRLDNVTDRTVVHPAGFPVLRSIDTKG